jgi:cupin fold WbuC family metalloprotein
VERPEIIRISPVATQSCHEAVAFVDRDLVERKAYDARRSPRRRDIHIFHRGDEDPLQRMLNAIQPGSYIRPHRHLDPPKSESLILLQGMLGYVSFRDDGTPRDDGFLLLDLDRGVLGCDIRPGVWHTIFALAPDTVIFEVKPGPYSPANDKDFAPWAPEEFIPASSDHSLPAPGRSLAPAAFLAHIEDAFRRLWGLPPRPWQLPVTTTP